MEVRQPLPTSTEEFDTDERISFSRLDNKYLGVLDDGSEFEWDVQLRRWIPVIDEELLAQQQSAYGVGPTDGDDSNDNNNRQNNRKRKANAGDGRQGNKKQRAPPQNTAVYVTGLPLDVTVDELHDVFSRKCGVIAEEIDSGRPRIKLYSDDKGNLQGDALVVFFKPQSVEMAIMLLDDTDFRYTPSGLSSGRMRVQAAESKYKKTQYDTDDKDGSASKDNNSQGNDNNTTNTTTNNNDNNNSSSISGNKPPRDKAREQEKQKIIKRTQKLDAKLADWDDDDDGPFAAQLETNRPKDRVVILRHMFTLKELDEDPAALLDIKEDIRDECSKLGVVTNVILYDLEEDGIASVKFKDPAAAAACIDLMDGRAFDGRVVRATIASHKEKFRRSDKNQDDDDGD